MKEQGALFSRRGVLASGALAILSSQAVRGSQANSKISVGLIGSGGRGSYDAAMVNADRDLGKAIKLDHTPTVYIVSSRNPSKPYVEVKDNSQLYTTIDTVMKQ